MGRNATGVRGMNLGKKDYIVGMATTPKTEEAKAMPRKSGRSRRPKSPT